MNFNPFANYPNADIYRTQADVYGNSFANPMNPANMNPGFGMDPNLMTPSYDAGYRPQYAGPQPYNPYGRVGFFSGISGIFDPRAVDQRFGNPIDNQRETIEGISTRPFDSVVWAGQRAIAPALGFGLAFKMFANPGMAMGNAMGRGFASGVSRGMGKFMPRPVAGALRGFLGGGTLPETMGGVGLPEFMAGARIPGLLGMGGYLAAPLIAGQMAMSAVQSTLVDPYINVRRSARTLRDNFSGVTFGDATGNAVTGQGLGFRESTRIAEAITKAGNSDMTFSTGEYGQIADYSARAGLLDDAKAKQISQRVKDISEQVKLVMSIASDPSVKEAIETLARLHGAGASMIGGTSSQASAALVQLGQSAAVAGRSVQNIMNTAGAQGQYLFQANGMTPYLGQLAAANVLGSFEVAKRNGLLNTSQLARMGGTEGAEQASLTGQINATQTLYNKMALYNRYLSGRGGAAGAGPGMKTSSVIGAFGSDFSKDPLGAYGKMMYFSQMLGGKEISERGSLALEDQATSIMDSLVLPKNKNGQYDASQMMPVLVNLMGMSQDEARAFLAQRASETDVGTFQQGMRARSAQTQKQLREYIATNYLYGGAIGKSVRGLRNLGHNIANAGTSLMGSFAEMQGIFGDSTQGFIDNFQFGSTIGNGRAISNVGQYVSDIMNGGDNSPASRSIKVLRGAGISKYYRIGRLGKDLGSIGSSLVNSGVMTVPDTRRVINRINALASNGSGPAAKAAQDFINAKTHSAKSKALGDLLKTSEMADLAPMINGTGQSDAARGNFDSLISDTLEFGTKDETVHGHKSGLIAKIDKTLGVHKGTVNLDFLDSLNAIGQASDIANKINGGASQEDVDEMLKSGNYKDLAKLVGNRTGKAASDYIVASYKRAVGAGLGQVGAVAFNGNFNVDAYIKDPSRIKDAGQRAKFVAAMKSGDRKTMETIVATQLGEYNGNRFIGQSLKNAESLDLNQVAGFEQQADQNSLAGAKAMDAYKAGRIDYATLQNIQNNLDTKKNNDAFSKAVDKFDKASEKILTGSPDGSSTSSLNFGGGWHFMTGFRTEGQQRDAGSPQNNR